MILMVHTINICRDDITMRYNSIEVGLFLMLTRPSFQLDWPTHSFLFS